MLLISNGHIGPERRIRSHNWLQGSWLDYVKTDHHQTYGDIECFPTNERPGKLAVNCVQDLLPAEEKAGLGVWKADLANLAEKSIICWELGQPVWKKKRNFDWTEYCSVSEFISLLSDHNFSQLKQNVTANWRSIQNFVKELQEESLNFLTLQAKMFEKESVELSALSESTYLVVLEISRVRVVCQMLLL